MVIVGIHDQIRDTTTSELPLYETTQGPGLELDEVDHQYFFDLILLSVGCYNK